MTEGRSPAEGIGGGEEDAASRMAYEEESEATMETTSFDEIVGLVGVDWDDDDNDCDLYSLMKRVQAAAAASASISAISVKVLRKIGSGRKSGN